MLTYCMNVHPGESLEEQISNITALAPRVLGRRADGAPAPLGLRFSARAAAEFAASAEAQGRLRRTLAEGGLAPFTMNAFPYGKFHAAAVKMDAYRPDWTDPARTAYTIEAGRALAALMPDGFAHGSVSTCPMTYKAFGGWRDGARRKAAAANIASALGGFQRIREETGKSLVLSMEPEPGCFPETTAESIAAVDEIRAAAPAATHPYIGVCFDTAHLAVEFEDLAESLRRFAAAGVRIGKTQFSAALECDDTPEARAALARYAEGVYMHQTMRRSAHPATRGAADASGAAEFFNDLPDFLASCPAPGATVRAHFHIPLCEAPAGLLRSTAPELRNADFHAALRESGCAQFEVETYTWDVWRRCSGSGGDICEGTARELAAVRAWMPWLDGGG